MHGGDRCLFSIPSMHMRSTLRFLFFLTACSLHAADSRSLYLKEADGSLLSIESLQLEDQQLRGQVDGKPWQAALSSIRLISTEPMSERQLKEERDFFLKRNDKTHLALTGMPRRYQIRIQVPDSAQLYVHPVVPDPETPNLEIPSLLIRRGEIGYTNFKAAKRTNDIKERMQARVPMKAALPRAVGKLHDITLQVDLEARTLQAQSGERPFPLWELPEMELPEDGRLWLRFQTRRKDQTLPLVQVSSWQVEEKQLPTAQAGAQDLLNLRNGDALRGRLLSIGEENLIWELSENQSLTLPLDSISLIQLRDPSSEKAETPPAP